MKALFHLIFSLFTLFSVAQTWQSAYDSCVKYQQKQEFLKSLEWGDKTLELYEKQVAVKDTNYSNILCLQVINCYYQGLYKQGEVYAKKDSVWTEKYNISRYPVSCNNLAVLYKNQENRILASLLYKEAMQIAEKVLGKESQIYASACNNLAIIYVEQGRYTEAEVLYKESMQIRASVLGKESLDYATSCNNLATLYKIQGRYVDAEMLYKEYMQINLKLVGKEHINYAYCCNNLGNLYAAQGKYLEAEKFLKEAMRIYLKILPKNHISYIQTKISLAFVYSKQKRYAEAESLYKKAMVAYNELKTKKYLDYATLCNNLGNLYQEQERYDEAESLYKEVVRIRSSMLGKMHPDYANICNNLGTLYKLQKRYNEAESLFKASNAVIIKAFNKHNLKYANSCNNLASTYTEQGRYLEAEPFYKEVITAIFKDIQNNFRNLSETEKESYIKANIELYFNSFLSFVLNYHPQNPTLTQDAYQLTIESKGLILQSIEKIKKRIFNSGDENLIRLYLEWKETKDKYARTTNIPIAQRKLNTDSLEQRANELEKQLSLKSEDFTNAFTTKSITWKDIQNTLKKNEAAIEIVRIEVNKHKMNVKDSVTYMVLIIKKTSPHPEIVILPHGNQLESMYLSYYRRNMNAKIQDKESYNIFWLPIKNALKGIKTVYLSSDGIYHQINLNTLQNPYTNRYVFDEIRIIHVTNTKDLVNRKNFISKNNYLIGNPKFDLQLDNKYNQKTDEQRSIENLSQLEGAEKEVKKISAILSNAKVVTGIEATEEYVKSIKNPRILHIATHGYFKKGQYQSSTQAMLNAGLLFAGVVDYDRMDIRPLDKEDGKLTAFEVMNMELDSTELVVLSACETGLGQASKEGVYGLQRAFKVAGAQSIIMSLWKVNDEATQLLMTKFYENWQKKGMDKRKAFETAQKDLRKQYKEPYYWGAFVMIE